MICIPAVGPKQCPLTDDEKDVKPVIINKITNNTKCTINNLTYTKKAVIFNESKTAKVKDTIKKRYKFGVVIWRRR